MAKALMLFLFLTFSGGCDAQVTMTQPPSVSAAIGETVKIACRRSSGSIGSLDSSANAAVLTISSVQTEDEADYYCLSYAGGNEYTMIQPHGEQPVQGSEESLTMAKGSMLVLILTYYWGCDAQVTMTQPPSVSASIGETIKISCRRSSGGISDYYNSWYQQKPGSAPKLLIYGDDLTASGISDRFSGSLDSSANAAVLTISNVQIDDEADYYCLAYVGSGQHTMIQLHGEVRQKPPFCRCALPCLCLADTPAESPVSSLVDEMQEVMGPPANSEPTQS
uniref:Uncharacterized protein n=1 Tax=Sphaerodactylus townsendi TaxID=933632 RepID=A0ACB8FZ04_9SAUR